MRMSVHWNVNLHPNSQAGGLSCADNLKATDSITTATSVCPSTVYLVSSSETLSLYLPSHRGCECQLNACKSSVVRTNIYTHIICVLNFHLISVFWASYVAVTIGGGEWITFWRDRQPLSSILISLMMRIGSDRSLCFILTVSLSQSLINDKD